ncbi:hypothetical protein [Streptomyces lavendulae]|uniref:hypothetical protein n=1 Tax=Streptomyces lavendulae TaxID=1914 RepID=UPI0033F5B092
MVLDRDGRILDGKGRLKACEIAGVEPKFTTYEGSDTEVFALSVNMRRRSLSKGHLAVIAAKAASATETERCSGAEQS